MQSGDAVLESVFGRLPVRSGDYVVVPTGVTHRWVVGDETVQLLVLESRSHVQIPRKYLTPTGQLAEGAPFSERDLRGPDPEPLLMDGRRRRGAREDPCRATAATSTATTRSTSSAGTAACTRGR